MRIVRAIAIYVVWFFALTSGAWAGKAYNGCYVGGQQVPDCVCEGTCSNNTGPSCNPGEVVMSSGLCMPAGALDCGSHYCNVGQRCAIGGGCAPANSVDCGDGHYCDAGHVCKPWGCMPAGAVDCGSHSCNAGNKCSRGGGCVPTGSVDCGNGEYCNAGNVCTPDHRCKRVASFEREVPFQLVDYDTQRDRLQLLISQLTSAHEKWKSGKYPKVWNRRRGVWEHLLEVAWTNHDTLYHALMDSLKIIAAGWAIPVPGHEEWVILKRRIDGELKGLMYQALQRSMILMVDQVSTLEPYKWEPEQRKAAARQVIDKTNKALKQIEESTAAHIDHGDAFIPSSDGSRIIYKPGSAIQQLGDIAEHPFWRDCSVLNACSSQ